MLNRDVFPLLALLLYPRRSGVDDDEVHRASDRSYSEKRRMSDRRRRRRRRQRGTRDITFARYRLIGITRFPIVSEKPDFALSLSLYLYLCLSRSFSFPLYAAYPRDLRSCGNKQTRKMQLPSRQQTRLARQLQAPCLN